MAINQFQTPQYYYPNGYSNQQSVGTPSTFPQTSVPTSALNPSSSLAWAIGEEGAKAYPVVPGNKVAIFDSTAPVVYIKEVGLDGKPLEMEIYDMVKREPVAPEPPKAEVDLSNYITRDEIATLIASSIKTEVDKAISEISLKPSKRKKGDDE